MGYNFDEAISVASDSSTLLSAFVYSVIVAPVAEEILCYFKLRDLAYALNGTTQEFYRSRMGRAKTCVVMLTSGQRYQPVGGRNGSN